jgi:hypothetical protein
MINALRMMMVSVTVSLAWPAAVHAAEPAATEEAGTLSKAATAAGPAVNTSSTPAAREPATGGPRAVVRADRLDLDTTVVTGNRELPKVLYIVPWKKSDLGDLPAQPFNTLLDEALTPIDRDVFRREVTYYGAVNGGPDGAPKAVSPPPERSEK